MTGYISLESVQMQYGDNVVVRGLDLDIPEGTLLTLLGPSGCGKTTTLRAIAGLERLSGGRLSIDGASVDCPAESAFVPPDRRSVGMVFQSYALWPQMTVRQNVAYPLRIQRMSKRDRIRRVDELLARVGLAGLADRVPSQLSGGQQQRVAVARALAREPKVLLFDEPLSNLDARLRKELRTEIRRVHQDSGATSVFVTHDQEEAMAVSDLVGVVLGGRLVQLDSPDVVYRSPGSREVAEFLGFENLIEVEPGPTGRPVIRGTGTPLPVPTDGALAAGGVVALRREHVQLVDDADQGDHRLKATVTTSTYVGGVTEFEAEVSGTILRCSVRDDYLARTERARPMPGETVLVSLPHRPQRVLSTVTTQEESKP